MMLRMMIASLLLVILPGAAPEQTAETIVIDGSAPAHAFPHFWEQMFGSGRAILSLRENYREDLQAVDQIYDGLLANGVRPFVELSFMPNKLAAKPILQAFWYKPDVAPPKDWAKWDNLITQFTKHLVDRYGIDEVSQWYFEVWNEPNIDFWGGDPKQATYWNLYDHTAHAVKAVNPRLRI